MVILNVVIDLDFGKPEILGSYVIWETGYLEQPFDRG